MVNRPIQTNCPIYIDDGYNIIRTDAPKDLGGRLRLNCALTIPELPKIMLVIDSLVKTYPESFTMWSSDLAPNNSYLSSSDLSMRTIYESNFFTEVETEDKSIIVKV